MENGDGTRSPVPSESNLEPSSRTGSKVVPPEHGAALPVATVAVAKSAGRDAERITGPPRSTREGPEAPAGPSKVPPQQTRK